jgi:3-dehydroquinate dehydratase II
LTGVCPLPVFPTETRGFSWSLDRFLRNRHNSPRFAVDHARPDILRFPLRRRGSMATILVLNGPNLNLLGSREPGHYGRATLTEIERGLAEQAAAAGHRLVFVQSNAEHVLIEAIHRAPQDDVRFILINPAAFTHTSVALRDALLAVAIPFIEVHLSNVHAREPFRKHSYFSDIAVGVISGLGAESYELALRAAIGRLSPLHSNENH